MYEIHVKQCLKYDEEIKGTTKTLDAAKDLMYMILRAFPNTKVSISMEEEANNIDTETETEEE